MGFVAVEVLLDHLFLALVILDLVLPMISGHEVLEKMRRIDPGVKVIISSGHGFENERESFSKLKADDYILKPYTITDLALSVRYVLDRK